MNRVKLSKRPDDFCDDWLRTSATRWNGFIVSERRGGPAGEWAEGQFSSHLLTLIIKPPAWREFYVPGKGWWEIAPVPNAFDFFPANAPHAARWKGAPDIVTFEMSPAYVEFIRGEQSKPLPELRAQACVIDEYLRNSVCLLARDLRSGCPSGNLYGEHVAAALVAHLFVRYGDRSCQDKRLGASRVRLNRVIEYINDQLHHPASLATLAEVAGIGIDQFLRSFKQHTGQTPHQYVLRRRIEHAETLLRDRRYSLSDVAAQVGFSDYSHFSKMFRRVVGVTPRAYRSGVDTPEPTSNLNGPR